jgi:hypothetical protein
VSTVSVSIALGSGAEGWISADLSQLRFVLEGRRASREMLTLAEMKTRYPRHLAQLADQLPAVIKGQ